MEQDAAACHALGQRLERRSSDRIEHHARTLTIGYLHHPRYQILFLGRDDMMCTGIDQGLALGAGTRRRDYRRADHPRNLEGSKADAAGGSSDDDEIALAEFRLLHQRTPGGDILHPHGRRFLERQRRRMLDDEAGGHVGDLAISAPARDIERGDDADGVAFRKPGHVRADRSDSPGSFVAEAARELGFLKVGMVAEHHLGAVYAYRLHRDLHFVGRGRGDCHIFNPEDAGVAIFVDTDNAAHGMLLDY